MPRLAASSATSASTGGRPRERSESIRSTWVTGKPRTMTTLL